MSIIGPIHILVMIFVIHLFIHFRSGVMAHTRRKDSKNRLENVAIANALQLGVARAKPALSRFNYDPMPSLTLLNL